jgi:phenylacetic acid degradation operon negative regulatory protein
MASLSPVPAASARSLLLTLLGEFVHPSSEPIWTSALLQAFAAVGVAEKAVRQTLARASAAGWIEGGRDGRQAWWRLAPASSDLIVEGSRRVRSLRQASQDWSGTWVLLHITLPETRRADRLRLYRALSWLGFGSPTPGLWICPHEDRASAAEAKVKELDLDDHTMAFQARGIDFGVQLAQLVAQAWDLNALAAHYRELEDRFSALRPRSEENVFVAHVQLVNELQRLPGIDPGLPAKLLPRGWDGERVTRRLEELRARWREQAHAHWRALCESA